MNLHATDKIKIPVYLLKSWQMTLDLLAETCAVPAALLKQVHGNEIEVLVKSQSPGNVYEQGERADLNSGLYCETVMATGKELLVPNALTAPGWAQNPDIEFGMISYCGLPVRWPNGKIFGTICVLDIKENHYSELHRKLLEEFRNSIQSGLQIAHDNHALKQTQAELRTLDKCLDQKVAERTASLEREIIEQREANDALRESVEQFQALYQSTTTSAIISVDDKGNLTSWNLGAEKTFGYSADDIVGQPITTLIPERYRKAHQAGFKRALKTKAYRIIGKSVELHGLHKDGHEFPVELSLGVWRSGNRTYFTAIMNDISERDQAKAASQRNQAFLQAVLNTVPGMISAKDLTSRYVFMNNYQAILYGTRPELVSGKKAGQLLSLEYGGKTEGFDKEVIRTGKTLGPYEETYADALGVEHTWLTTKSPVKNEHGQITHIVSSAIDITSLKQAEEALKSALDDAEKANRSKSAFLASMSHDLRTPLNSILGFIQLIEEEIYGPVGNEKYREYHKIIHGSATHLLWLVNEILDLSQLEANKFEVNLEIYDPLEHTASLIKTFDPIVRENNILIEFSHSENMPPVVRADKKVAMQIQSNLISNAIRFSPEGSVIKVRWSLTDEDRFVFEVRDCGEGFSDSILENYGQPFLVSDPVHSSGAKKSFGLGLYICKRYIEARGGTLTLTNIPGGGASVVASWPADILRAPAVDY